jgi:hypothetical protein
MAVNEQDIPGSVNEWIYSGERAEREAEVLAFVSGELLEHVHELVRGAYDHSLSLPAFVEAMKQLVPGPAGEQLARDFLGYDFLRAQEWFSDDISAMLKTLGSEPLEYKTLLNGDEAIEDALRGVNVELIPPRTRDAIFVRMQEFLNGDMDKAGLLEAMMKSPKIGGWGWDQDTAVPVIEKLETHLKEAEEKHAAFVSKAKFAEIAAKREAVKKLMADMPVQAVTPAAVAEVAAPVIVPVAEAVVVADPFLELAAQADPFASIVSENLPHLADSELSLPTLPNPFEELLREIESQTVARGFELPPPPQLDYAYANVHEHRGVVETESPKSPFERALHASDILLENELREIEHRKEELMKDVPETAIVVSSTLDALVERIMNESHFASEDTSLVRRIRNIVSSRLRDIRGSEETAKLISKISQGTRDLSHDMVEKLVMLTEQAFLEFQRKVIERGLQRERARRVRDREEVLEQRREEVFNSEKELNARFKKLTGKDSQITLPRGEELRELAPPAPVAAPVPERKINVTVSPKTVLPAQQQLRNEPVSDVKYVRQLAGPVEELRTMRLTDFRRLSKDAKTATQKVMAKVDLLAADSTDKRVQGVVAWRESPVMKLYLAITKAALDEATPLVAIIEKKKKEIPEMLTLEECQAIRELNTKLRY